MGDSDLPLASGKKHQKVFESLGWWFAETLRTSS